MSPPQIEDRICDDTPQQEKLLGALPLCYKTIKTIMVDNVEMKTVRRGCTLTGGFHDFCEEQRKTDENVICITCNRDSCNGADNLTFYKAFTLLTTALIWQLLLKVLI
jgi:hypothetical protein